VGVVNGDQLLVWFNIQMLCL